MYPYLLSTENSVLKTAVVKEETGELNPHNVVTHVPSLLNRLLQKYNLSQSNIEKQCDDNIFLTLLPHISFNHSAFVFRLTQPEIEEIQKDFSTQKLRSLNMLWKWRRRTGSDATYLAITKLFLHMNDRYLAEIVLRYVFNISPHQ